MQRRTWWGEDAACQGVGHHIFFPDTKKGDCKGKLVALYAEAKTYCERCPVTSECLESQLKWEVDTFQHDGMWGGLTPTERRVLIADREWKKRSPR
jgi:WhiB family redox-sensing transcriptional regulator